MRKCIAKVCYEYLTVGYKNCYNMLYVADYIGEAAIDFIADELDDKGVLTRTTLNSGWTLLEHIPTGASVRFLAYKVSPSWLSGAGKISRVFCDFEQVPNDIDKFIAALGPFDTVNNLHGIKWED